MKFGQRPCTIVQGLWPNFGATLKIRKKSNFDRNQLKISTQHKYMYMYAFYIIIISNIILTFYHPVLGSNLAVTASRLQALHSVSIN